MSILQKLYDDYSHDGLLEDDIVELIKVTAKIPGVVNFETVFVTQVSHTISLFYNCVMNIQVNPKMQEEAQKIIDSNKLKNMMSIFNVYILRNEDFQASP